MTLNVTYLPEALSDLQAILAELRHASPTTVDKLHAELVVVERQLSAFPFSYQRTQDPDTRRVVLRSCRYTLYFRASEASVLIVAVLPQMAGPDYLESRGVSH